MALLVSQRLSMTLKELNPKGHELDATTQDNLEKLAEKVSVLEGAYGQPFTVTSGFRTKEEQQKINPPVKRSCHLTGEAVDISDTTGEIWTWLVDNMDLLIDLGVYLESRTWTPRWVHLQSKAPKSGNRIFIP